MHSEVYFSPKRSNLFLILPRVLHALPIFIILGCIILTILGKYSPTVQFSKFTWTESMITLTQNRLNLENAAIIRSRILFLTVCYLKTWRLEIYRTLRSSFKKFPEFVRVFRGIIWHNLQDLLLWTTKCTLISFVALRMRSEGNA